MYPGTTETDYYAGTVTQAAPDLLRAADEGGAVNGEAIVFWFLLSWGPSACCSAAGRCTAPCGWRSR